MADLKVKCLPANAKVPKRDLSSDPYSFYFPIDKMQLWFNLKGTNLLRQTIYNLFITYRSKTNIITISDLTTNKIVFNKKV